MPIRRRVTLGTVLAVLIAVSFTAAGGNAVPPAYTLQVLHLYGETGTIANDTAPVMGAMVDKFRSAYPSTTLTLAEGDTWIPGPWLVGGADPTVSAVPGIGSTALGRPDVAIMNALGVNASSLGNHEFDLGSPIVSGAVVSSGSWVGAQFPFVAANLDFAADSSLRGLADVTLGGSNAANLFAGKEASTIKGKFAPSAIVTLNGEKIGIVGATTPDLLIKTSPNGTKPKDDANAATDDIQEIAAYLQGAIDGLTAAGVNKIVMVDQLDEIARNEALAPLISGVDVMVAGGGHERLGDANDTAVGFNGHTANFVGDYPIAVSDKDGNPTLIVTTDTEFTYLGRLVVDFDANGVLIPASLDDVVNGAYASSPAILEAVYNNGQNAADIVSGSVTGAKIKAISNAITSVVTAKDGIKFGFSDVYLEGDRFFGRAQEVNLGDITADANAYRAAAAGAGPYLFSLKNGGGLRASIGSIDEDGNKVANPVAPGSAGNISLLDVENALRFDNKLMVFDTTPQGLLNILNHGAGLSAGNGGYPQVGGVRFSYDPALAVGSRVRNVALYNLDGSQAAKVVADGVVLPGAPASIQVVSLNFTANGGDGYPTKANGSNFRYLLANGTLSAPIDPLLDFAAVANLPAGALGEQKALEDYLKGEHGTPETAFDMADTPASGDLRIQNLGARADAVFDVRPPVITTPGDLNVDGNMLGGANVGYAVTVNDDPDPSPSLSCSAPGASGGFVPIGTTTVTCNAEDSAGNTATASFMITVIGAPDQIIALKARVNGLPSLQSKKGQHTAKELTRTLDEAYRELVQRRGSHVRHACLKLGKFIFEVRLVTGTRDGKVTPAEAATLIADARRIRAVLGC